MSDKELLELAAKASGIFMTPNDWPFSNPYTEADFAFYFNDEEISITGPRVWFSDTGEIGGSQSYT